MHQYIVNNCHLNARLRGILTKMFYQQLTFRGVFFLSQLTFSLWPSLKLNKKWLLQDFEGEGYLMQSQFIEVNQKW